MEGPVPPLVTVTARAPPPASSLAGLAPPVRRRWSPRGSPYVCVEARAAAALDARPLPGEGSPFAGWGQGLPHDCRGPRSVGLCPASNADGVAVGNGLCAPSSEGVGRSGPGLSRGGRP